MTLLQHTLFCREAHTRSQNRHRTKEKKRQPNKRYRRKKIFLQIAKMSTHRGQWAWARWQNIYTQLSSDIKWNSQFDIWLWTPWVSECECVRVFMALENACSSAVSFLWSKFAKYFFWHRQPIHQSNPVTSTETFGMFVNRSYRNDIEMAALMRHDEWKGRSSQFFGNCLNAAIFALRFSRFLHLSPYFLELCCLFSKYFAFQIESWNLKLPLK